jgi:signal transduction histidine kinase
MSDPSQWQEIAHQGFLFSGTVSAAVTHEIRNKLAIVNEKAGLLEDFAEMFVRGRPFDPEQLRAQARGIRDQVRQADEVVGRLNRFAHSADHPLLRTDAAQLVALVLELTARTARTAGVRLELPQPAEPAYLTTFPFLFEHLVFQCVGLGLACPNETREVGVTVEAGAEAVRVYFTDLSRADDQLAALKATAGTAALLAAVRASLETASDGTELVLEALDLGEADVEDR